MGLFLEISGLQFGNLTAVEPVRTANGGYRWRCNCLCGNTKTTSAYELINGDCLSCGCVKKNKWDLPLNGLKLGKLLLISNFNDGGYMWWNCLCECGKTTIMQQHNLLKPDRGAGDRPYRSCGCAAHDHLRHRDQTGENNHMWKGGRRENKAGYVSIRYPNEHPRKVKDAVLEHILVMEEKIGRHILSSETIHHINGIKNDNRSENLELWDNRHPKGQRYDEKLEFYTSWVMETCSEDELKQILTKIQIKLSNVPTI